MSNQNLVPWLPADLKKELAERPVMVSFNDGCFVTLFGWSDSEDSWIYYIDTIKGSIPYSTKLFHFSPEK